jgi:hypothetical protein
VVSLLIICIRSTVRRKCNAALAYEHAPVAP